MGEMQILQSKDKGTLPKFSSHSAANENLEEIEISWLNKQLRAIEGTMFWNLEKRSFFKSTFAISHNRVILYDLKSIWKVYLKVVLHLKLNANWIGFVLNKLSF